MPGRVPGTTPKSRVVASNSALTVLAGDGKMVEIFTPDEPSTPAAKTPSGKTTPSPMNTAIPSTPPIGVPNGKKLVQVTTRGQPTRRFVTASANSSQPEVVDLDGAPVPPPTKD